MEGLNIKDPARCIGEHVVYRNNGIYRICDMRIEKFCGINERTYFVMCSVYDKSSMIFVPTDAKDIVTNMRRILSPSEIDAAISQAESSVNVWVEDVKERAEYFDRLFDSGSCSDILWLYNVLSDHKAETEKNRRKLYASDARILAAAEKIITDEFSFVLGIEKNEVLPYINEKIEKNTPPDANNRSLL